MNWLDELLAQAAAAKKKGKKKAAPSGHRPGGTSAGAEAPQRPRFEVLPGERAVALCTVVQIQHCRCCGGYTESIGGQYVNLHNPRLHYVRSVGVSAPALSLTDTEIQNLALRIDSVERDVAMCPSCLRTYQSVDHFLSAADAEQWDGIQLPLWRRG
jgi:hypothetical protein